LNHDQHLRKLDTMATPAAGTFTVCDFAGDLMRDDDAGAPKLSEFVG
jgi:hypothetical protein